MQIFKFQENVRVESIPNKGKGLMATRDSKRGETIFIVSGKICHSFSQYTVPVSAVTIIDTELGDGFCTEAYYLNHSCEPSTYLQDGAVCVASRDLQAGEEITIHYGTLGVFGDEWKREDRICICGSEKCPGTVNGYNEMTEEELMRLEPYIQDWVKEKYGNR
jgi:hypothetical protein